MSGMKEKKKDRALREKELGVSEEEKQSEDKGIKSPRKKKKRVLSGINMKQF